MNILPIKKIQQIVYKYFLFNMITIYFSGKYIGNIYVYDLYYIDLAEIQIYSF